MSSFTLKLSLWYQYHVIKTTLIQATIRQLLNAGAHLLEDRNFPVLLQHNVGHYHRSPHNTNDQSNK